MGGFFLEGLPSFGSMGPGGYSGGTSTGASLGSTIGGLGGSFLGPLGSAAGSAIGGLIGGIPGLFAGHKPPKWDRQYLDLGFPMLAYYMDQLGDPLMEQYFKGNKKGAQRWKDTFGESFGDTTGRGGGWANPTGQVSAGMFRS